MLNVLNVLTHPEGGTQRVQRCSIYCVHLIVFLIVSNFVREEGADKYICTSRGASNRVFAQLVQ